MQFRRPSSSRPRLEDRPTPRDDREADEQYLEDEAFGAGRDGSPLPRGASARERWAWEQGRQQRQRDMQRQYQPAIDELDRRGGRAQSRRSTEQRDYSDAEMAEWRKRKGLGLAK